MQTLFAVSKWPRIQKLFGIAHGWPGVVWTALQLDACGVLPMNPQIFAATRDRLKLQSNVYFKKSVCISSLIGSGSYALISALMYARNELPLESFRKSVRMWIRNCEQSSESDVMLGAAGALLACAEIESAMPGKLNSRFLRKLRDDVDAGLRKSLSALLDGKPVYLGFSHGIAGYLFALEMCDSVFGLKFEHALRTECFDAITANRLRLTNNAMIWAAKSGEDSIFYHSWCHGAPGIGLALLYSHDLTGFDAYREIAEEALEGTFRFQSPATNFCCGSTGRAQILMEAFKLTGKTAWLKKVKHIADGIQFPSERSTYNGGFHGGMLGYDYLLWRLKYPGPLPLPGLGIFSSKDFC